MPGQGRFRFREKPAAPSGSPFPFRASLDYSQASSSSLRFDISRHPTPPSPPLSFLTFSTAEGQRKSSGEFGLFTLTERDCLPRDSVHFRLCCIFSTAAREERTELARMEFPLTSRIETRLRYTGCRRENRTAGVFGFEDVSVMI